MTDKDIQDPIKLRDEEIDALVSVFKSEDDNDNIAKKIILHTKEGIKNKRIKEQTSTNNRIGSKVYVDEKSKMEQLILDSFNNLSDSDKLKIINDFIISNQESLGPTVKEIINTFETEEKKEEIRFKHYVAKLTLAIVSVVMAILIVLFTFKILFSNETINLKDINNDIGIFTTIYDIIKIMFFTKLD